jgi:glycyl-tRNA synthetase beta chain
VSRDILVEIGTEELPPKSLKGLSDAFVHGVAEQLQNVGLSYSQAKGYATPRRLAVLVSAVAERQPDNQIEKLGPSVAAAFDHEDKPTKAAEGFARSCGTSVNQLETIKTNKGERLVFRGIEAGSATKDLLVGIIELALAGLPVARRMRWGAGRYEFVRPVHWVLMLYGDKVVNGSLMGVTIKNVTYGHRFHKPEKVVIGDPQDYVELLRKAYVIADFNERREIIRAQLKKESARHQGSVVIDELLLEEVAALNEWPVSLSGRFDDRFLDMPPLVLISTMQEHQKYFHVVDLNGKLLPVFIAVANIESSDPRRVIAGNERVIRPRLSDASFFYTADLKTPLSKQREKLKNILFQEKLGSLYAKTERVALLADYLATSIGYDATFARQAAQLSKADLATEMVQEFPSLQGSMGHHYALAENLDGALAAALSEHYLPRFSNDELPQTETGIVVALADRLDTLVGIFAIGQFPTGSSDPFALRRASVALLRIVVEHKISLDLRLVLKKSAELYDHIPVSLACVERALTYIIDRTHAWFEEQQISTLAVQAVIARGLTDLLDISQRVYAINDFAGQPEAKTLAAANKRVANILTKQNFAGGKVLDTTLLNEPVEIILAQSITNLSDQVQHCVTQRKYREALGLLATLKEPIDAFFDEVMILVEDEQLRTNRLTLLNQLRELFLEVADISLLVPANQT